ncbi:hypothetical protein NKG05_08655 [Oerskovia sp. M15]
MVADGLGAVTAGEIVTAQVSRLNLTSIGSPANTGVSAYLVPAGTAFDQANPGRPSPRARSRTGQPAST